MRTENQKRTAEMLQLFDNHDLRLPFYELRLERELTDLIDIPMPSGYHLVTYQPGDRDAWIGIEKSAREFTTWEEGMAAWQKYYEGHDEELKSRMVFAVNSCGKKVATATAFYDIRTGDDGINGWLHWVAVCREAQGCGLSKPLINHVLHYMKELGYRHAVIPT